MPFYPESIVGSEVDGITYENEYASDEGKISWNRPPKRVHKETYHLSPDTKNVGKRSEAPLIWFSAKAAWFASPLCHYRFRGDLTVSLSRVTNFMFSLLTRKSHSMKNLDFSLLTQMKDDYTTNFHYLTYTFPVKRLRECTVWNRTVTSQFCLIDKMGSWRIALNLEGKGLPAIYGSRL